MNNEKKYQLIEDYLDGILSSEKVDYVENLIANDIDFATEVRLHKELQETLGNPDLQDLSEKIKRITHKESKTQKSNYPKVIAFMVLLSIIIGIGYLIIKPFNPSSEELFEQYADIPEKQTYFPLDAVRTGNNDEDKSTKEDTILKNYFELYNNGSLEEAEKLLSTIQPNDYNEYDLKFQKGLVSFRMGKFQEAVDFFLEAQAGQDMSKWYAALCYLKLNEIPKAKDLLKEISGSVHPRQIQAEQLLRDLN
jgi:tetratricopeptide (TPR) repeat protein